MVSSQLIIGLTVLSCFEIIRKHAELRCLESGPSKGRGKSSSVDRSAVKQPEEVEPGVLQAKRPKEVVPGRHYGER